LHGTENAIAIEGRLRIIETGPFAAEVGEAMKRLGMVLGAAAATVATIAFAAGTDNNSKQQPWPRPSPPPVYTPHTPNAAAWGSRSTPHLPPAASRQAASSSSSTSVYVYSPYGYASYPYGGSYAYGCYPSYGGYGSGYSYGYPYGAAYPYGATPYSYFYPAYSPFGPGWYSPYSAAAFTPADQLFGPAPIMRMMGVDQWFSQPMAAPARRVGAAGRRDQDAAPRATDEPKPAPRPAGAKATEQAWKMIGIGDAYFANRKYADALDRYRRAAQSAPQLADAWFRQGFANAAMGHYDRAAKAVKRGLELKPDWANSDFRLDDLFGDDAVAKKKQLDALLRAADSNAGDGDAWLLAGLYYYFDGKPDRAAPFLRRAAEINGNDAAMKNFLAGKEEKEEKADGAGGF
jgi:tetratricopeptide (TPR) repeat protein